MLPTASKKTGLFRRKRAGKRDGGQEKAPKYALHSGAARRIIRRRNWVRLDPVSQKSSISNCSTIPPSNQYFDLVVRYPWHLCTCYLLTFVTAMVFATLAFGVPALEMAFVGLEARGDGLAFGSTFNHALTRELDADRLARNETQDDESDEESNRKGIVDPSNMVLWFASEDGLTRNFVKRTCKAGLELRDACSDHTHCHLCNNCEDGTLFTIARAINELFPNHEIVDHHPTGCTFSQDTLNKFEEMMDKCYDLVNRQSAAQCKSKELWDLVFSYAVPLSWKPHGRLNETTVVVALEKAAMDPNVVGPENRAADIYDDVLEPLLSQQDLLGASLYSIYGKGNMFLSTVVHELWYACASFSVIFCIVLWHTKSPFISVAGFVVILVSLCGTGAIYHLTVPFWPFLNLLLIFVVIAIGVDDIFVYMDTWSLSFTTIPPETPLANRIAWTTKSAASSMAVTTITDSVSFLANIVSPVTSLRVFGIFSGVGILSNYLLLILVLPCLTTIISEGWVASLEKKVASFVCSPFASKKKSSNIRRIDIFFSDKLGGFVCRARIPLALIFSILGVCLIPVALLLDRSAPGRNTLYVHAHPLEKWDLAGYTHFKFSETQELLNVAVVFGVTNKDNGNKFTPISKKDQYDAALPTLEYLPLNIEASRATSYFEKLCDEARSQDWFNQDITTCPVQNYTTPNMSEPKILLLILPTTVSLEGTFKEQARTVNEIDTWIQPLLKDAPNGLQDCWWYPHGFEYFILTGGLREGVPVAMAISVLVAFFVLLVTTSNIVASFLATLTVAFSVFAIVSCMVIVGWSLAVIECIILTLAVGFTVDFTCHLSHAYMHAHNSDATWSMNERQVRVRSAAGNLGVSVSMAAFTTLLGGCVMLPASSLIYFQFGLYLIMCMSVSWAYAFFFFLPIMAIFGPISKTSE